MDAELGQLPGGSRPDIEKVADRQPPGGFPKILRGNDGGSVRLFHIGTQLGKDLVVGHAYRYRQTKFTPDAGANVIGNRYTVSKQAG